MKPQTKRIMIVFLVVFFFIITIGAYSSGSQETKKEEKKGPITVASKIDTEGALLGQMIVHRLQEEGFEVNDKTQFGTTDVIRKAIKSGEIDIYPEYTGNGGFFFSDTDSTIWKNPEKGFQTVKRLDKERNNLIWLQPAPANNTWAIAVRKNLAEENNLQTLEDFAEYVNNGGYVKIACSEEFASRPDALPAFEKTYGFSLKKSQMLILSGGNTATTEKAAAQKTDGVNTAMAYGTDGQLSALGLVVLEDSKNVQPVYQPAPLVRAEVLEGYPEIETMFNDFFQTLDLETLQRLNASIAVQGKPAKEVAKNYLEPYE